MNSLLVPRKGWRGALTSIRGRLALLGALAVVAVLVVSLIELMALQRMLTRVEAEANASRVARAQRSLTRLTQRKAGTVREFAIWDEAYEFASDPRAPRFRDFLRDNYTGWLPAYYGDRVIKIWNRRHESLLDWADSSLVASDRWIPTEELIATTERLRTFGGFFATPNGLFLVGGSVILRISDVTAGGKPNGFVIAAQPVDAAMEREMGQDLQQQVRFLPVGDGMVLDSPVSSINAAGDSISIRFPLAGVNGAAVGVVELRDSRGEMGGMYSFAYVVLTATLIGGLLALVMLWLAMKRLVVRPLGAIADELIVMQQQGELRALTTAHPATEWRLFSRAFNNTVKALRLSEERYHVLFQRSVDAYILIDSFSNTILEANPAAEVLAGCSERAMIGRALSMILDFSAASEHAGGFTLRRPDGSSNRVGVVRTEIRLGGLPRTLVAIRDLSHYERKQTTLRLAEKMDAIGTLAGGVAHDFNNLLGAILVANSALRVDLDDRTDVADSLDTIDRAARRASDLTSQLLQLSRGKLPPSLPPVRNEVPDSPAAAPRPNGGPARMVRGHERILVIDDDTSLRSAMCRSLQRLGYTVKGAEGGLAGLKAVEQDQAGFDLVLLDVMMPDLGGVETFKRLRLLQPDLRILICSGFAAEAESRELVSAGADAFLPKPFDMAELAHAVREMLSRSTVSRP